MILVTVGMQLGFDRLIEAMDALAPTFEMEVVAQTGKGKFRPNHMRAYEKIGPAEFEALAQQASVIVSHAGIGTILTARRFAKPIVVMPRLFSRGEHRNDHQIATTQQLKGRPGIVIAEDETKLHESIMQAMAGTAPDQSELSSQESLHQAIERFINGADL